MWSLLLPFSPLLPPSPPPTVRRTWALILRARTPLRRTWTPPFEGAGSPCAAGSSITQAAAGYPADRGRLLCVSCGPWLQSCCLSLFLSLSLSLSLSSTSLLFHSLPLSLIFSSISFSMYIYFSLPPFFLPSPYLSPLSFLLYRSFSLFLCPAVSCLCTYRHQLVIKVLYIYLFIHIIILYFFCSAINFYTDRG